MSDLQPDNPGVEFSACLAGVHTRASWWTEFDDGAKLVLEIPESDAAVHALLRRMKKHRLRVTVESLGALSD